jgi:hypothetical protein
MQAEEGLPDKPVELPSAGDMQLNATAAAEAGVEKPPTVVGATAALVGTGVDSDGDGTKVVHDPSNPNRESAGVDQKMLDELNNEVNKATGKKIDWAKKRFTPKEIKNSEAAADEAGKAEDAERGAVAIAGEATKDETHASHQADGLVKKMQAEEGLPDKPVELPSAGDMQLNATAAAEAGVEKPPTVVAPESIDEFMASAQEGAEAAAESVTDPMAGSPMSPERLAHLAQLAQTEMQEPALEPVSSAAASMVPEAAAAEVVPSDAAAAEVVPSDDAVEKQEETQFENEEAQEQQKDINALAEVSQQIPQVAPLSQAEVAMPPAQDDEIGVSDKLSSEDQMAAMIKASVASALNNAGVAVDEEAINAALMQENQ